jgi:hypothetical protein
MVLLYSYNNWTLLNHNSENQFQNKHRSVEAVSGYKGEDPNSEKNENEAQNGHIYPRKPQKGLDPGKTSNEHGSERPDTKKVERTPVYIGHSNWTLWDVR